MNKNILKIFLWPFINDPKPETFENTVAGLRIGFRLLIYSRFIERIVSATIFMILLIVGFAFWNVSRLLIILPYLSLIILFSLTILLSFTYAEFFGFNVKQGVKTFFFLITGLASFKILGFISIFYLFTIFYFNSSQILATATISMISIFLMFFVLFLSYIYNLIFFQLKSDIFIDYSSKIINNIPDGEKLSHCEKSKIYHAMNIYYELNNKKVRNWFGKDVLDSIEYEILHKVPVLIGVIDNDDKETQKEYLKILDKIKNNDWFEKPKNLIEIKNDIENLSSKNKINIKISKKEPKIILLRKYSVPAILTINFLYVIINLLSTPFQTFLS